MAVLQVAYWRGIGEYTPGGIAQVPSGLVSSEAVNITGTSTQSAAWPSGASIAELYAEADCFVAMGANPDAGTGARFAMAAGTHRYIGISDGLSKFAVITRTVA